MISVVINVKAQESKIPRNQIEVSYGFYTTSHFLGKVFTTMKKSIGSGRETNDTSSYYDLWKSKGNLNISYKYRPLKKLYVGLSFICDFDNAVKTNKNGTNFGISNFNLYTIALEIKYLYLNNKIIQLYGFLGAGYSLTFNKEFNDLKFFNGQLTPLGIRIGNKIGGFAEIGFGYKGVANIGLSLNI